MKVLQHGKHWVAPEYPKRKRCDCGCVFLYNRDEIITDIIGDKIICPECGRSFRLESKQEPEPVKPLTPEQIIESEFKPIKFNRTGGGNYTDVYDVEILKPDLTVGEFIKYVLGTKDWGDMRFYESEFVSYLFEYKYGKLTDGPTDDVKDRISDRTIAKITASGGWSRMDYQILMQ